MQTLSASLPITLPLPPKRKKSELVIATAGYAAFDLASKFLWPNVHQRSENLLHLLAETAFQTILFAIFFTLFRFIWPRRIKPADDASSAQFRQDMAEKRQPASRKRTGVSGE